MKSCFVIMPIGDQKYGDHIVKKEELKKRYDDLIKEAILMARPDFEVIRSDDISLPGTITTDILTRIMHSDIVVVDITYPNPNVFYELGIRHAVKPGTILLKEKSVTFNVFDISHLRHIEYENTPSGLKELTASLLDIFNQIDKYPDRADNHFLELAKLVKFKYPQYSDELELKEKQKAGAISLYMSILSRLLKNPDY